MPNLLARRPAMQVVPLTDASETGPYVPTPERPVRAKRSRAMEPDTHFLPHRHPWAQIAYCASGVIHVGVQPMAEPGASGAASPEVAYIVPPSRAVWIAPGCAHAVTVVEAADLHTLYVDPAALPHSWGSSRVITVTPLLRELFLALESAPPGERERHLGALALDEITRARTQALGVPLPAPVHGDKRLRALCEAALRAPGERATLHELARHCGASERTAARLFREQLGTTWRQWRQQAVLAHALPRLARGEAVGRIALECGYASESAFSAMFGAAMGQPPSAFRAAA